MSLGPRGGGVQQGIKDIFLHMLCFHEFRPFYMHAYVLACLFACMMCLHTDVHDPPGEGTPQELTHKPNAKGINATFKRVLGIIGRKKWVLLGK